MRLRLACLSLICLFSFSGYAQTGEVPTVGYGGQGGRGETCLRQIDSLFRAQQGTFALAFYDLSTGRKLALHEHEVFHAASTMKTPVLVEIYRQAALGRLRLSDSIVLKNEFPSIADSSTYQLDSADDSETTLYRHLGERRTVSELVYQMITVSSNFATNLLINVAGPGN